MARSAQEDAILKFRFKVTVLAIDYSLSSAIQTAGVLGASAGILNGATSKFTVLTRAGFSEATLPKANVNTMHYRENTDNLRFTKSPGLVKFDPIVLRRGATDNQDLFNWYRQVNDDALLLSAAQELSGAASALPSMTEHFRNEVLIEVIDREGNSVKQWMLFNAFPNSYKGGNDLNAATEEILVEEIGLDYEFFVELKGGLGGGLSALLADAAQAGIDYSAAKANLPFLQ